jgi:hypothetical protein
MNANPTVTRSILFNIVEALVFRVVSPLGHFFSGSVYLQRFRKNRIRAYARRHNVYLVPEVLTQPEQCPCYQHTTSLLVHSAKRSYCFDCWNARREGHPSKSTFHLDLSFREWRYLGELLQITSANLKRILGGQPAEYFEQKDFDLFAHLCEGIIEAWGSSERTFQSPASIPRDAERITVDLNPQEITLIRKSAIVVAEVWKASLEPSAVREFPYGMLLKAEWAASIQAIELLTEKLSHKLPFAAADLYLEAPIVRSASAPAYRPADARAR